MEKNYVKIIGVKFDALEGLNVITDANRQNIIDAAEFAQNHDDHNIIWIVVPCNYIMK